jgi:hypothetical protein
MRIGLNVKMLDRLIAELQATHDANFPQTPLIEDPHELITLRVLQAGAILARYLATRS